MPAPPDPSHSTPDSERLRDGDGLRGAASAGADRFWQEFSRARTERPRRGRTEAGVPPKPEEEKAEGHECLEWCPICRSADVLRAAGGPEVRHQLASMQRDSLLALRTLIDAYLARAAPPPPSPWDPPQGHPGEAPRRPGQPAEPPVQDIPLD